MKETNPEKLAAAEAEFKGLTSMEEITPADLVALYSLIKPEYAGSATTALSSGEWLQLAAIHRLNSEELMALVLAELRGPLAHGPMVGLHDVINKIQALAEFTGLPKYIQLCQQITAYQQTANQGHAP